jgi:hypothetical protein
VVVELCGVRTGYVVNGVGGHLTKLSSFQSLFSRQW